MSSPDQLAEIEAQLDAVFKDQQLITITPTQGNPPDLYRITYNFSGVGRNSKAEIDFVERQVIDLAIPFGYPHFPPTCKPYSDIFHPDFDPAAICLGDFWNPNRSLVELIIHIGRMLNGEIYSRDNAFNEEAAIWFDENRDRLPVNDIDWHSFGEIPTTQQGKDDGIDTLEEDDIKVDFDLKNLDEEEISLGSTFPEIDETPQIDQETINLLESQRNLFQLLKLLKEGGPANEELQNHVQESVREAKKLYSRAKNKEKAGDTTKALELYRQARELAADYPKINQIIDRLEESSQPAQGDDTSQLDDVLKDDAPPPPPPPDHVKPAAREPLNTITEKPKHKKQRMGAKTSPARAFGLGGGFLLLLAVGAGGYLYFQDRNSLQQATTSFHNCQGALAQSSFSEAEKLCQKAKNMAMAVRFVDTDKAHTTIKKATEILQSPTLVQGLQGKILVDGRYISKKDADLLKEYSSRMSSGQALFAEGQWSSAAQEYQSALDLTSQSAVFTATQKEEPLTQLQLSQLNLLFDKARELIATKKYEGAQETFGQAQRLLDQMGDQAPQHFSAEMTRLLLNAQFEDYKTEAEQLFSQADWERATEAYERTLAAAKKTAKPASQEVIALEQKLKKARLYTTISRGNQAFTTGDWDKAIDAYDQALSFLRNNKDLENTTEFSASSQKLAKIILQTRIIKTRQDATQAVTAENLNQARSLYQRAIDQIQRSTFAGQPEFISLTKEFTQYIAELDEKIFLADQTAYLEKNFRKLFITNYPMADPNNLHNPLISHYRETPDKHIFRLQCTERGQGRPLTLVMFYSLDKNSGTWGFYSEN